MDSNNKKNYNFRFAMSGLLIVCGGILFYYLLFHFDNLLDRIGALLSVFSPVFIGIAIAYIPNPIMRFIEKKALYPLWNKIKKKKDHVYSKEAVVIRVFSTLFTMVLFFALIYALIQSVVPQMITNIGEIIKKIGTFNLEVFWATNFPQFNNVFKGSGNIPDMIYDYLNSFLEDMLTNLKNFNNYTDYITKFSSYAAPVLTTILNFIIGLIISIYLLLDKEKYLAQLKKVLYAVFKREHANNFINNLRYSDKIFGGFITGKVIDSMIIGVLCYLGVLVIGTRYAVLVSVIIGVTNIIPYFGPFIGAIPCGLIILAEDWKKCIIFLIFIFVLQQFDGNILGPKILGSSIGLNGLWVIFAITVFSKILGTIGVFMGVPIFAVIYAALRTLVNKRLEIKHMPVNTDYYVKSDYIIDEDGVTNSGQSFRFAKKTFDKVTRDTIADDEDRAHHTAEAEKLLNEKDNNTES